MTMYNQSTLDESFNDIPHYLHATKNIYTHDTVDEEDLGIPLTPVYYDDILEYDDTFIMEDLPRCHMVLPLDDGEFLKSDKSSITNLLLKKDTLISKITYANRDKIKNDLQLERYIYRKYFTYLSAGITPHIVNIIDTGNCVLDKRKRRMHLSSFDKMFPPNEEHVLSYVTNEYIKGVNFLNWLTLVKLVNLVI